MSHTGDLERVLGCSNHSHDYTRHSETNSDNGSIHVPVAAAHVDAAAVIESISIFYVKELCSELKRIVYPFYCCYHNKSQR
mmetsp:Transcript_25991/g.53394  ORF Transcript_25991/g.53394 Transcript_25991/m.53394 type:complete len:81 (-) Transcript_25991:1713-1955(-)